LFLKHGFVPGSIPAEISLFGVISAFFTASSFYSLKAVFHEHSVTQNFNYITFS